MPEIKATFTGGKMNQDLDERLIPNGQYREALNIQVSTSEGSDVGTVQNILGNSQLNSFLGGGSIGGNWKCVGAIADEKNDALYWFIHNSGGKDAILEYKDGDIRLVLVTLEGSAPLPGQSNRSVLGFTGDLITGINILSGDDEEDKLLLWTDNVNEPRKINIQRCIDGTTALNLPTRLIVNGNIVINKDVAAFTTNSGGGGSGWSGPNSTNFVSLDLNDIGTASNPIIKIGDKLLEFETGSSGYMWTPTTSGGVYVTDIDYATGDITFTGPVYTGTGNFAIGHKFVFESYVLLAEEHINVIKTNPTKPPTIKLEANTRTGNVTGLTNGTNGGTQLVTVQNGVTIQKREGDSVDLYIAQTNDTIYLGMGVEGEVPAGNQPDVITEINWKVGDVLLIQRHNPTGLNTGPLQFNYFARLKVLSKSNPYQISGSTESEQYFETELIEVKDLLTPNPIPPLDPALGPNLFEVTLEEKEEGIFETKFPRFAYRYKYEDNEYSAFSPFSEPAFLPSGFSYHPTRNPYNLGMMNYTRSVTVQDFVPANIPKDVVQVDLLYKEDGSTTVYSIDSFKFDDPIDSGSLRNPWNSIGSTPTNFLNTQTLKDKGSYEITSDNVKAAIPSNQLLRPWDNVPRKAKSQEITGNRIVYGNYLQNYDLSTKPIVKAGYRTRAMTSSDYIDRSVAHKSIKSLRDYQVGVVYGDKYGRETPVFTEDDASFNVPFKESQDSNQIYASLYGPQPEWADYYKIYIKQSSGEYYNMVMDRVYRAEDEGNLWISFPSSDRNKITEESFISLKKQVDINSAVTEKNKFKVIDIKNEAPEFIKSKYVQITEMTSNNLDGVGITQLVGEVPTSNASQISFNAGMYETYFPSLFDTEGRKLNEEPISFIFYNTTNGVTRASKRYKASSYSQATTLMFTFHEPIDEETDSWIATTSGDYADGVSLKIFKEEKLDKQEFVGRFFVKIVQNQITDKFVEGQIERQVVERVTGTTDFYYLADHNGTYNSSYQNTQNNFDSTISGHYLSSSKADWIDNFKFGTGTIDPNWFIDQCYFRSNQSNYSLDPNDSKDEGPNYFRGIFTAGENYTTGGVNAFQDNPNFYKEGKAYMNFSFGPVGTDLHELGSTQQGKDHGDLDWGSLRDVKNQFSDSFDEAKHRNQWNTGSSMEKKLVAGTKFRFKKLNGDLDETTYEITNVMIRRSYNFMPWGYVQAAINDYQNGSDFFSVGYSGAEGQTALYRMGEFGRKTNRRITFVCEIKSIGTVGEGNIISPNDPTSDDPESSYNPINPDESAATEDQTVGIEFTTTFVDEEKNDISVNPAVWETEPKDLPELNIYYEASQAYPLSLDAEDSIKSTLLAPVGSVVWCSNPQYNRTSPERNLNSNDPHYNSSHVRWEAPQVVKWEGNEVELYPGLDVDTEEATNENDQSTAYNGEILRFYRPDMSFTSAKITEVTKVQTNTTGTMSAHKVRKVKVDIKLTSGLPWSNCYSFANGVESNRIRDDFNKPTISNGVRASTTIEEPYAKERRGSGLIYSGLYNSTNGVNNLNQFIQAEKITKDLSPIYGSIQKLFQRRISLIAFCEDRVVGIVAGKDTLYNADGNPQLVATNKVLGDSKPFVGDYGISKDPASFAKDSYRAYFTDRQRGAVLRLSMDGLTPISSAGMHDYFKDNLKSAENLIGSYDAKKDNYNLTIDNGPTTYPGSTTVSYSEDVKGWVSFKSFIPEFGLSMANDYYTFYEGKLHRHDNQNRNTFYQGSGDANSFVETIINESPSTIKNFHTLNYDGDEGWTAIINTDKQSGTVGEFIEKEGKFFNYIKGENGVIDTAAFNFQGMGTVQGIDGYGGFEMQIRELTSPANADGAARVVYTGTNIEATGFTYIWSNGAITSEATGLGMGPISLTLTDALGNTHIVMHPTIPQNFVAASIINGCTNPNATNFNYSANTDDGTCTI
jgi:hypothetical protein